jgi:hypothetical protein
MKNLGKIVSKIVSRNVKNSIKFDLALDSINDKVQKESTEVLIKTQNEADPIKATKSLGDLKNTLKESLSQLNNIKASLLKVVSSLTVLDTIGSSVNTALVSNIIVPSYSYL